MSEKKVFSLGLRSPLRVIEGSTKRKVQTEEFRSAEILSGKIMPKPYAVACQSSFEAKTAAEANAASGQTKRKLNIKETEVDTFTETHKSIDVERQNYRDKQAFEDKCNRSWSSGDRPYKENPSGPIFSSESEIGKLLRGLEKHVQSSMIHEDPREAGRLFLAPSIEDYLKKN